MLGVIGTAFIASQLHSHQCILKTLGLQNKMKKNGCEGQYNRVGVKQLSFVQLFVMFFSFYFCLSFKFVC